MESKEKFTDFLDRMNTLLQDCEKRGHIIVGIEDIKSVFPELAESDDERIRKDIITYIQVANQVIPQFQKDKWITWLEKQGEKKPVEWSEEDEKIKDGLIASLARISANTRTDSTSINYCFSKEIDWLKSIKQRIGG